MKTAFKKILNSISQDDSNDVIVDKVNKIKEIILESKSDNTILSYFCYARNALVDIIDDADQIKKIYNILSISKERIKVVNSDKLKKMKNRLDNKTEIDINKIIKFISGYDEKNEDNHLRHVFLAATSGRRMLEILLSKFERNDNNNEVLFSNQLKLKGRDDVKYVIPLLVNNTLFLNELAKFRKLHKYNVKDKLKTSKKINYHLNRLTQDMFNCKPYTLRKSYVIILKAVNDKYKGKDKLNIINDLFNHKDDDIRTSAHYINIKKKDEIELPTYKRRARKKHVNII